MHFQVREEFVHDPLEHVLCANWLSPFISVSSALSVPALGVERYPFDFTVTGVALSRGFTGSPTDSRISVSMAFPHVATGRSGIAILAFQPDLASIVRGFASQHHFLREPDLELVTNLNYATAVAMALILWRGGAGPVCEDGPGLADWWIQLRTPPVLPLH